MTEFNVGFQQMADAVVRCAHLMRDVVPLLEQMNPNAARINEICEQIRRVEGDSDEIHEAGMLELYRNCPPDQVLRFIAQREVLDQLERIVDRFDDAANAVSEILVEHV